MTQFQEERQKLLKQYQQDHSGMAFVSRYAALMDRRLKDLFASAVGRSTPPDGIALAALGGYGRGALAPYSDVDLLFLTSSVHRRDFASIIELVLYPLWDEKLDVGHAVRTPGQCLSLAKEDFASLSTQLDARLLVGDQKLFAQFEKKLHQWLSSRRSRRDFMKSLKESIETRHNKYGASPYLLEPNVKEGQGALRDIHAVGWVGYGLYQTKDPAHLSHLGLLSKERVQDLADGRRFITDVRVQLHYLTGEKSDALTFDLQEKVSRFLRYTDQDHASGVERFMQAYYTRVYRVKSALDYFLSRVDENLTAPRMWQLTKQPRMIEKGLSILRGAVELGGRDEIRRRPALMMRAFEISAKSGLPLSQRALEAIRTNLDLVDDKFRNDKLVAASFLKGLTAVPHYQTRMPANLDAMQALHFLEAYIPELAGVMARVQHDAYHVYTVDVHLVVTLWELKKIAMGVDDPHGNGFDAAVMEQVQDRRPLFLAALLHDIGKGHGGEHSRRGAEMIPEIGRRLNLPEEIIDAVRFLTAEHLFMAEVAMRRDLSDERLIVKTAWRIGDLARLNMLYLLTVADSKATGPGVLNPWKLSLLRDLYSKAYRVLTHSELGRKETVHRTDQLLLDVVAALEDELTPHEVDAHLEKMSAHYLSTMTAGDVVKHIHMERQLKKGQLIWETEEKDGFYEVTVMTHDRPGLLYRMAGVFTLNNVNILGAQVFTRANNVALDIFHVEPPPDPLRTEEAWAHMKQDAQKVLTGRLALNYRLSKKRPLLGRDKKVVGRPNRVVVDNDASDFYTIVEVYTHDRLGVLYSITQTFFDLQVVIHIAKISTTVDQVVDVFYVRDALGEKLSDDEQISELKEALLFTLSQ